MVMLSDLTTTALVVASLGFHVLALDLPADNDRAATRADIARFAQVWPPGDYMAVAKVDASASAEQPLDLSLSATAGPLVAFVYPFEYERQFTGGWISALLRETWWASLVASGMYLVTLRVGMSIMADRKAFDLKAPLAFWNLLLAVFSFLGALRTMWHLLAVIHNFGFDYTVCRTPLRSYGSGPPGLWVSLFIFSKYAELLDTAFLVLRKRNVSFLHWYHHCSVLVYTVFASMYESPTGIYFVSMNYCVHAIMYWYYFLAAVGTPPKWGLFVTILQLSQMLVGIVVTVYHLFTLNAGYVRDCDGFKPTLYAALGMYASYFLLFAQFLVQRYCLKRPSGKRQEGMEKVTKKNE